MPATNDKRHAVWMRLKNGALYTPEMTLARAMRDELIRDLADGQYDGVCEAVYSYPDGGDVTAEIARELGGRSLDTYTTPYGELREFLDTHNVDYWDEDRDEERREAIPANRRRTVSELHGVAR